MKQIYYFSRYAIIMVIGYLIKYFGINSIFSLPYWILIIYNYVALRYGIKKPLELRRDIKYKELIIPFLIFSSLLNTILIFISSGNITNWLVLLIGNGIELFFIKPKHEVIEAKTQKNIEDYFNQHK